MFFRGKLIGILYLQVNAFVARHFLDILSKIAKGIEVHESYLVSIGKDMPKKHDSRKMIISSRAEYPLGRSFPETTRELHINAIPLRTFDERIVSLLHLSVLSLVDSKIKEIPPSIEHMKLTSLNLRSNCLLEWPVLHHNSPLSTSLRSLDLSFNQLKWLPENFWILKHLQTILITGRFLKILAFLCLFTRQ